MFSVVYSFHVKDGADQELIKSWEGLTRLIYRHEKSLGSRLHKNKDGIYIAYAQWPDKTTWENAGSNLPKEADQYKTIMRNSCTEIKTVFELNAVSNMLTSKQYSS
jgi:hypothetical protein